MSQSATVASVTGVSPLDRMTPLDQVIFAAVDVETTGGSLARGDRVCEVGIVRAQGGIILDRWSTLVQPERAMNSIVAAKTGIRDSMLRTAPRFVAIAAEVQARLQGAVFVAHGANFDERFLRAELSRAGYPPQDFPDTILDTVRLAQTQYTFPTYKLADLSAHLRLPPLLGAHRALPDTLQVWAILWQIITDLRSRGVPLQTLGDLLTLQQAPAPRYSAPPPERTPLPPAPAQVPSVTTRVARWLRIEQEESAQQLAALLTTWLQPWSQAPIETAVRLADVDMVADVCIQYPMGWRLMHQIVQTALTPADLAARTQQLAAAGIDVVWWLGPDADTPANQQWCQAHRGWRGTVTLAAAQPFVLWQTQVEYESLVEMAESDNQYTRYWRRLALARYIELWQRVRMAEILRGLAGTAQLSRSIIGAIGVANARGTMQKQGDAWYAVGRATVYSHRVQPWTPATVASVRALARQRASGNGGQVRGA